jgi:hypothetical protein
MAPPTTPLRAHRFRQLQLSLLVVPFSGSALQYEARLRHGTTSACIRA